MLHISASKNMHICIFVTVTVHICTVTVNLVSNNLDFFLSVTSLSELLTLTSLLFYLSPSPYLCCSQILLFNLRSFSSI